MTGHRKGCQCSKCIDRYHAAVRRNSINMATSEDLNWLSLAYLYSTLSDSSLDTSHSSSHYSSDYGSSSSSSSDYSSSSYDSSSSFDSSF